MEQVMKEDPELKAKYEEGAAKASRKGVMSSAAAMMALAMVHSEADEPSAAMVSLMLGMAMGIVAAGRGLNVIDDALAEELLPPKGSGARAELIGHYKMIVSTFEAHRQAQVMLAEGANASEVLQFVTRFLMGASEAASMAAKDIKAN